MKKLLVLFLLIFSVSSPGQSFRYGWITDLHIGAGSADQDLREVVRNINSRNDIKFVIATGDISEKGLNTELESAKEILDSLNIDYYIIPGNHDTKWSESGGAKFKELWKDDKFRFEHSEIQFIGLNSGVLWRGGGGHIAPEDLDWLDIVLKEIGPDKEIIFSVHHQLDSETDNWFEVTNRLRNYRVSLIHVGHGHANKLYTFNGIPGAMSRSTLSRDKGWGYTIVENLTDSIAFYEAGKDTSLKFWGGFSKKKETDIPMIDSVQAFNYKAELTWKKEFRTTMSAAPVIYKDKVYVTSVSGILSCLNTTGKLLWDYDAYGTIVSRPAADDDIVIVGTIQGDLTTLDANTGESIQTLSLGEPITSQLITIDYKGDKILMTGMKPKKGIIIGTASGRLLCYDLYSLELIWENDKASGMIETEPLHVENKIIFGSWDNYLYCYDSRSGVMNWRWTENKNFYYSPAACRPVTNGKNVFVATPDKFVSSIDLLLGKTDWRTDKYPAWESIGISADSQRILIKGFEDKFHILSAAEGKLIKSLNVDFGLDTSPVSPISNNDDIYFGTKSGFIYLIDSQYNFEPVLFCGTSRITGIVPGTDNNFIVVNMDGKVISFKVKGK